MKISGFSPYVLDLSAIKVRGPDVPFLAGALLNIEAPQIDGYEVFVGSDMGGLDDFSCGTGSVDRCVVAGPPEIAALKCNAKPACQGFVYWPEGIFRNTTAPECVLKSASGRQLTQADTHLNPMSASYLKSLELANSTSSPDPDNSSEASSGTSTVVIAVVASIVGAFLIAGIIGMVLYIRRYKKMMRSFPHQNGLADQDGVIVSSNGEAKPDDAPNHIAVLEMHSGSNSENSAELGSLSGSGANGAGLHHPHPENNSSDNTNLTLASSGSVMTDLPSNSLGLPVYHPQMQFELERSHQQRVLVSEVTPSSSFPYGHGNVPNNSILSLGSSARDLLDAFSQMYKERPAVDYNSFAKMLEDGEASAAAEAEKKAEALTAIDKGATTGFSSEDWKISPDEIEVCRRPDGSWWQLGTGAFGTVYKGLYHGVHDVAVKVLHRLEDKCHSDAFEREVMLLKALRHHNVVQFLGAALNGPQGTALLVTELMELGDLWRALPAKDPTTSERIFSWHRRGRRVMEDVARGLHYLHSKRVVHFDLKSANILLSRAGTAKLADIGMARVLNKSYLSVVSSGLGTFAWSAPEVLTGRRCSEKADIYSFGIVLFEICTGEAPVRGDMRPLRAPDDCPEEVVSLYERCVAEDPQIRPTAKELVDIISGLAPAGSSI